MMKILKKNSCPYRESNPGPGSSKLSLLRVGVEKNQPGYKKPLVFNRKNPDRKTQAFLSKNGFLVGFLIFIRIFN
jgi:hypothetical protein